MCLILEFRASHADIWDDAFEVVPAVKFGNARRLSQSALKTFVSVHKNSEAVVGVLFSKYYSAASALLGKTTSSGKDVNKFKKYGGVAQWLRAIAKKIDIAAHTEMRTKQIGVIASMMREAHSSSKKTKNLLLEAVRDDVSDDDLALPPTYEDATRLVARRTERFMVGGRGILANGSNVGITGRSEPIIGVGQAIAIGLCRQVPFQPHLARLLVNGPLRYPGAHYILRASSGEPENLPLEGFANEQEALDWARDAIVVARHIQDGDLVGVTRSPFVAPHNHLFMPVRILSGLTVRPHDIILSATDADFDGDAEIVYVANDMVAQEQWKAQMPARLLTYSSGVQAQTAMLDGRFGLESTMCAEVEPVVFFAALSCLPDLVADDIDEQPFTNERRFHRADILKLCGAERRLEDGKGLNDEIRRLLVRKGPRSAMRLLFNAQNAGTALAGGVAPPGFRLQHFLPSPGLDLCQRAVASALSKKKFSRGSVGMAAARRDYHEVVVGCLEPVMSLTYSEYDDEDLGTLAEIAQQIEREDGEALDALRKKLLVKLKKTKSTTYTHEDLRLKIKSVSDAAQIAVGILRGSVSTEPRTMAAVRWPHHQPSLLLGDKMSSSVSHIGSQLLAIHATEGMSSKAQIEKTGDIRNNVTALLSDLRRDWDGALWSGDQQLISRRAMPISLSVVPAALRNGLVECDLTPTPCPWETVVVAPPPGDEVLPGSLPKAKRALLEQELDLLQDQTPEYTDGAYCTREHILRELSGMKLPICSGALVSPGPIDASFEITHPPVLCSLCDRPLQVLEDSLGCSDMGCGGIVETRTLQYWTGVAAPEATEPVAGVPHPQGELRRRVLSGDVRLRRTKQASSKVLYPPRLQAAHRRGARRAGAEENPGFLRLELDAGLLEQAGFTELDQFDLERRISSIIARDAPDSALACVLSWEAPSTLEGLPIVLVHVYGHIGASAKASAEASRGMFGLGGARLYCPAHQEDTFQMQFENASPDVVDLAIETIPTTAARVLRIVGDGPASLRHGGPEEAERQMVLDQCGGKEDFQRSGPARILAAKRTAGGGLLSVKSRARDRPCELMAKGTKRAAFSALERAALVGGNGHVPSSWLGHPTQVGVAAVRLFEEPSDRKQRLAQAWNRVPLPDGLHPGPPVHSSRWLTFEERSRALGIRALQIVLEGAACEDGDDSPQNMALKELEDRSLPFAVARDYLDEHQKMCTELVWIAMLTPIPDEYPEGVLKKQRRT